MKKLFVLFLLAFSALRVSAQVDTLYLSHLYTTHISFETNLSYVDVSNTSIISALVPENSMNILALIAIEPFDTSASITAIEESGRIKTYVVEYREHPEALIVDARPKPEVVQPAVQAVQPAAPAPQKPQARKEVRQKESSPAPAPSLSVSSKNEVATTARAVAPTVKSVLEEKQGVFHVADSQFGVKATCLNVLVYSDVVYLVLQLENGSGISYQTGIPTFMLESARRNGGRTGKSRTVAGDGGIFIPKSTAGTLSASPGQTSRLSLCFDKLTLAKGQVFNIYINETGGQRNLVMSLSARDINRARSL